MSETTCPCGKTPSTCPAKPSTTGQNGKGDAPRNISPRFRKNFDNIRWSGERPRLKPGKKYVKVY
jgi:hypothetical protein